METIQKVEVPDSPQEVILFRRPHVRRDADHKIIGARFKVIVFCPACNKEVVATKLVFGTNHVYAYHCNQNWDVGVIA